MNDQPIGTLLLYYFSDSWTSKLIALFRWTQYTHALLKISDDEYIEMNFEGVRILKYDDLMRRSGCHNFFLPKFKVKSKHLKTMRNYIDKEKDNLKYDKWGFIGQFLRIIKVRKWMIANSENKFFCSVFVCFLASIMENGISKAKKKWHLAPDELSGSMFWHKKVVYTINNFSQYGKD